MVLQMLFGCLPSFTWAAYKKYNQQSDKKMLFVTCKLIGVCKFTTPGSPEAGLKEKKYCKRVLKKH